MTYMSLDAQSMMCLTRPVLMGRKSLVGSLVPIIACTLGIHASSVPILLNPETGTITPQFHVIFDDWFATVNSNVEDLPDFNSDDRCWMKMFGDSAYQYMLDEADLHALDKLSEVLLNTYDSEIAEFAPNQVCNE